MDLPLYYTRDIYITTKNAIPENVIDGIIAIGKALVYLAPVIIYLVYRYVLKKETRKPFTTIDDIEEDKLNMLKKERKLNMLFFAIFMAIGIKALFFHKPNNAEISLGILINYLKNNGILDRKIYEVLKQYKPTNISKFVK